MFGQMRKSSGSRAESVKPCPCGGKCLCHKPSDIDFESVFLIGLSIIFILAFIIGYSFLGSRVHQTRPETIYVGNEECEICFKQTGSTSTGAPIGHNEVICPSWKK